MTIGDEKARVKVKALVWHAANNGGKNVWTPDEDLWPCWIVELDGRFVWCEEIGIEFAPVSPARGSFDTLADAQAAVEKDREARINSAIEQDGEANEA